VALTVMEFSHNVLGTILRYAHHWHKKNSWRLPEIAPVVPPFSGATAQ